MHHDRPLIRNHQLPSLAAAISSSFPYEDRCFLTLAYFVVSIPPYNGAMPSTQRHRKLSRTLPGGEEIRQLVRVVLTGTFAWALLALSPYAISPAHAQQEIHLNSSNVQVVHNTGTNKDILNMTLNVESDGDGSGDPCDGGDDDLLETGVEVAVFAHTCQDYFDTCFSFPFVCPTLPFDFVVSPYVEHDIGNTSYGTFFGVNGPGSVSSKIVALASPNGTCGTWSINLQATGLDLSSITSSPIALFLEDFDGDADGSGILCIDGVNANIGNGITNPHHGVHSVRH